MSNCLQFRCEVCFLSALTAAGFVARGRPPVNDLTWGGACTCQGRDRACRLIGAFMCSIQRSPITSKNEVDLLFSSCKRGLETL